MNEVDQIYKALGEYLMPEFVSFEVAERGANDCPVVIFSKPTEKPPSKSAAAAYERAMKEFAEAVERVEQYGGSVLGGPELHGEPLGPFSKLEVERCVNTVKAALTAYAVIQTWNGEWLNTLSVSIAKHGSKQARSVARVAKAATAILAVLPIALLAGVFA